MYGEEIFSANIFKNTVTDAYNNPSKHITHSSKKHQDIFLYNILIKLWTTITTEYTII